MVRMKGQSQSHQRLQKRRPVVLMQIFNTFFEALLGIATALDTLGSQAFGAADRPALISWVLTSFVVLSVLCVPAAGVLLCGETIAATVFSQPPEIAQVQHRESPE